MNIQIKYLSRVVPPTYSTPGSAAIDLRSTIATTLYYNASVLIPTGIAIHIADPSTAGLIVPRSGLGHKGIILGNGSGIIDSDYQGEILVSLWNRTEQPFKISRGDRIAQLLFIRIEQADFVEMKEFEKSERGENGFGSSGVK
jgi:dUTP diphosphatase